MKVICKQYETDHLESSSESLLDTLRRDQSVFSGVKDLAVSFIAKDKHQRASFDNHPFATTFVSDRQAHTLLSSIDQLVKGTTILINDLLANKAPNLQRCFKIMEPYIYPKTGLANDVKWIRKLFTEAEIHGCEAPPSQGSSPYREKLLQEVGLYQEQQAQCCVLL